MNEWFVVAYEWFVVAYLTIGVFAGLVTSWMVRDDIRRGGDPGLFDWTVSICFGLVTVIGWPFALPATLWVWHDGRR